jgi:hypothetical protein
MRFRITHRRAERGPADFEGGPGATDVEVPAGAVALLGAIGGIVPALIAVLTFFLVTKPAADRTRRAEEMNERMCAFLTGTQLSDAEERRAALRLLIAAGVLEATPTLSAVVEDASVSIPRIPIAFDYDGCVANNASEASGEELPPSTSEAEGT